MKYLISVLLIIVSFGLKAQSFTPESHRQFPFIKIDSGAIFTPGDTVGRSSIAGGLRFKNSDHAFYFHDGTKWRPFVTDSLGMIYRLNNKVDSLTLSSNILYYWKVGVGYGVTLPIGTDSAFTRISAPNDSTLIFYRFNHDSIIVSVPTGVGGGIGTVTAVSTNNGTGITGGTISTTGTLAIDTLKIATRVWHKKGIDSLAALKLNITDTANIRLRPIAGSNVTITGTYPNLTFVSTGSGGTPNNPIGTGFPIAIGVNAKDIKSLDTGFAAKLDTALTGKIRIAVDSAKLFQFAKRKTDSSTIYANEPVYFIYDTLLHSYTIYIRTGSNIQDGYLTTADHLKFDNKPDSVTLSGVVIKVWYGGSSTDFTIQSADTTRSGLMNNTTQGVNGNKTLYGNVNIGGGVNASPILTIQSSSINTALLFKAGGRTDLRIQGYATGGLYNSQGHRFTDSSNTIQFANIDNSGINIYRDSINNASHKFLKDSTVINNAVIKFPLLPSSNNSDDSMMVIKQSTGAVGKRAIPSGGGSMVYPGAGIPLSTGSAWGTSITNNSSNWNTVLNRILYSDTTYLLYTRHYMDSLLTAIGAGKNIYNIDGTLTGNRMVDANNHTFDIRNMQSGSIVAGSLFGANGQFSVATNSAIISSTNAGSISSLMLTTANGSSGFGVTKKIAAVMATDPAKWYVTLDSNILRTKADSIVIDIPTKGSGKVLTSDSNGYATWQTPTGGSGGGNVYQDANKNVGISNSDSGFATTATAAGTTTLTNASKYNQTFTGSTTQTVVLPDATTLLAGHAYYIVNNSSGVVTVNKNGGTLIKAMAAGTSMAVTVTDISSAAGGWTVEYSTDLSIGVATATSINGFATSQSATASTIAVRDANTNLFNNNTIESYTTTATAAGTTTLTVSSTYQQFFTGATTQIVTLPVTSTLTLGHSFLIVNSSTGLVTVNSSGANAVIILAASTSAVITCILTSGTTAASWSVSYAGTNAATGKKLTVNNTLIFAGTDGQTMTFPAATTTVGGLGTTQTWTGANTFNNASVLAGAATMAIFNTTATNVSAFGAATTMAVGGTPTTAVTHSYSANATATATTKTVNLGTAGASGSTTRINVGSAVSGATSSTSINGYTAMPASYFTPVTGGTVTTVQTANIIEPAGTLATLTVNLPSTPVDGQICTYTFTQVITALTFGNGTFVNTATAATAGQVIKWIYNTAQTKWYRWD